MDGKRQTAGRFFCLAMGLLLLLCGCSPVAEQVSPTPTAEVTPSPPPTPVPTETPVPTWEPEYHYNPDSASHDTYEIDVGDGKHIFRLEAVSEGKWIESRDYTLLFYEGDAEEPYQVIGSDIVVWPEHFDFRIEDINFDGYMDFYFLHNRGTHNSYYAYYVWDKETEKFIEDPYGLSELENPYFDHGQKTVSSSYHTSIRGGSISYYRYTNNKELKCVRVCSSIYEHAPESATLRVEDFVDGEWKTVFEVKRASKEEFTEEEWEEYARWKDIWYAHYESRTLDLDIGDGKHRFWVEITRRESEENGIPITMTIYDSREKNTIVQSWEDVCFLYQFEHINIESRDLDFDGDMDLEYSSWLCARSAGRAYWVWDEASELFVRDPYGLEDLSWPEFDQEKKLVTTWYNGGGGTGDAYYRYLDGTLTCIRRLSRNVETSGEWKVVGVVEDYQNGKLREVYREEFADQGEAWPHTKEFDRWYDLDYHDEG